MPINEIVFADDIKNMIDASVLQRDATYEDVYALINACKKYGFVCAFSWPSYMKLLREELKGTGTRLGAIVSFPSGQEPTTIKVAQAKYALEKGVRKSTW